MRALADFAIAAVDFARAESRRFKRGVFGFGILLALCIVVGMLVFLGFASIVAAIYLAMSAQMAPPTAAMLTGLITMILAGLLLWITKQVAM